MIAPTLSPDGNFIKYYAKDSGHVYQVSLDGKNKSTINNQDLTGLADVLWSSDKTKVISKFMKPDGTVQFFYYDYLTQKGVPIKNNVDEISWQSNGNKIFYKYYDPESKKRSLNISDPDGSNWTKLSDIDYRNVNVEQIPQSGLVSFWNKPDAFSETDFESVPVVGGEKKLILQGKFGADYLWNNDGTYALVSNTDQKGGSKMQLSTINYNGGEYKNLGVPTFVSKCVWSRDNKTVYYALPGGIPDSAILPNEYDDGKITTTDTFWKIDTTTGKKDRIVELDNMTGQYDAASLFLNSDESQLFFVNKSDGKLWGINL